MPRLPAETLASQGKIRRSTLSPEDHRLILAALAHFALAVQQDRNVFAGMKNRAYELRDARTRIERIEELHSRIEQFDKLEGVTSA